MKQLKSTILSIAIITSMSAALTIPVSVQAAGAWKTINGAACFGRNDSADRLNRWTRGAEATTNTFTHVYCPLEVETQYATPMEVWVNYEKKAGSSMSCKLHRRSYSGTSGAFSSYSMPEGVGSSFKSLSTLASGSMMVVCRLYKVGDKITSINHRLN